MLLLLSKGVAIDANDFKERTPLHFAAERGQIAVAEILLDNGADIEAKTHVGWTPLAYSKITEQSAAVDFFLTRGAVAEAQPQPGLPRLVRFPNSLHTVVLLTIVLLLLIWYRRVRTARNSHVPVLSS